MIYRFALPDLGEGVAEGEVIEWLVEPGQTVAADDPIAEVGTDKVDVEIPSPVTGVIAKLSVAAGQTVPVGTVLAEIATEDVPADGSSPSAPAAAAGNLATRLGVDLASMPTRGSRPAATEVREARETGDGGQRRRTTIARRLTAAAAVPTVTNVWEVDFEAVIATGTRPLTAVAHASVVALGEQRTLNAWGEDDGSVREHEEVHLGIATQAPQGLVVPVVHDAQLMPAGELEAAIAAVTTAAREGRARPDELSGSTFTISSAGRLAGEFATPLLNLPEVAILGLYRVRPRAVVVDGEVAVRQMANLSIGFDHRAVDGLAAATFLARVGELVSGWSIGEESGDA